MTDNPLAAWLRDDDEGAGPSTPPVDDGPGLDGWDDPPPRRAGPGTRLLAAAVLPWLVVAVLGVVLVTGRSDADVAPPEVPVVATGSSAQPSPAPTPAAGAGSQPPAAADGNPAATPTATAGDGEQVAAVAAALVADAVVAGGGYPAQLSVEGVEWVGDVGVARVVSAVLRSQDGAWAGGGIARYGVGVRVAGGAAVALGAPWPLPPPTLAATPAGQPVSDPDVTSGVVAALDAAGYRDVTALAVEADASLPDLLVARMSALAPGGAARGEHVVWLRAHPRPAVLALPAPFQEVVP